MSAYDAKKNELTYTEQSKIASVTAESDALAVLTVANWLDVTAWRHQRKSNQVASPGQAADYATIREFDLEITCDAAETISSPALYGIRLLPLTNADDTFTATAASPSVLTATSHGLLTGDGPFRLHGTDTFTATAATPSVLTSTAHNMTTGDGPFQLTTSGTLPAGMALTTDYWVEKIDANTYYICTSKRGAIEGTGRVAATDTGSGTHNIVGNARTVAASSGMLPEGFLSGTDYWVVTIDANTFSIATSLANAIAGTKVAATGTGSNTQTIGDKVAADFPNTDENTKRCHAVLYGDINGGTTLTVGTGGQIGYIERIQHSPLTLYYSVLGTSATGAQTCTIRAIPVQTVEE